MKWSWFFSHSPALVVIGTKTSAIRQVSGLMKPNLCRAAGHSALSTVNSAPSGIRTITTWISSTWAGMPLMTVGTLHLVSVQ